jgi:hypothetical protein
LPVLLAAPAALLVAPPTAREGFRSPCPISSARDGAGEVEAVAVSTDLYQIGFGEEWLVVTRDRLLVFGPDVGFPTPMP